MSEKLEIVIHATDSASAQLQGIGKSISTLGVVGLAAGVAIGAIGTALGVAGAAIGKGIMEAGQWQEGIAQLNAGLISTSGAAGVTAEMVTNLAEAMQKETRYTDDAVLAAGNLALTFTNIKANIFPDVIRLSADMATRMKMDLNSALLMVAKSMQDPITGATALRRAGVMLTDSQEELIKKLVQTGDGMGAQKIILRELATEFEGSAVAAGNTVPGQLDKIANSINSLLEGFGTALMPALQTVTGQLIATFNDPQVQTGVATLATSVGEGLTPIMQNFADYLRDDATRDVQNFGDTLGELGSKVNAFVTTFKAGWDILQMGGDILGLVGNKVKGETPFITTPAAEVFGPPLPKGWLTGKPGTGGVLGPPTPAPKFAPTGYNFSGMGATPGAGAALSALGDTGLSMSMSDVLARAFGTMGEAQGWQGAFQSVQGRAAGVTDVRNKMAGDMFAQKYGRAATDEEWIARYYSKDSSFEGIDEKGAGLDEMFGKPGTWETLIAEQAKEDKKRTDELSIAFNKVMRGSPLPVTIVTAPGNTYGGGASGASNSVAGTHFSTELAFSRM